MRALFKDEKAQDGGGPAPPFWLLLRALRRFADGEGRGRLPLSGALPDMHADTRSYVELHGIFRAQVRADRRRARRPARIVCCSRPDAPAPARWGGGRVEWRRRGEAVVCAVGRRPLRSEAAGSLAARSSYTGIAV